MRKPKKKTWQSLREEKCPKCGAGLMNDLFGTGEVGCACGFNVKGPVKDLLVKRDKDD